MDNQLTFFFIDDEFENFWDILQGVSELNSVHIFPYKSIESGIDALHLSGGCDGIILDLFFPGDRLQGVEGLKIIQEEFPGMPVIILTASYQSKDIKTAIDCIKLGALNYIGKDTLNPVALINQLIVAGQNYLISRINKKRIEGFKESNDNIVPAFIKGNKQYFSFKLEYIASSTPSETDNYIEMAYDWHVNFIRLISFSYLQRAKVELIYKKAAKKNSIDIYFLFCSEGEGDLSDINLRQLIDDVTPVFLNPIHEKKQVYYFSVLKENEIENLLKESLNYTKITNLHQKMVEFKTSEKLGFHNDSKSQDFARIPLTRSSATKDIQSLLRFFYNLDIEGEINIALEPNRLSYNEAGLLNLISQGKLRATNETDLSLIENVCFNAGLLNKNLLSLFKTFVSLRTNATRNETHDKLRIAIAESFDKDPYELIYETDLEKKSSLDFNYYTATTVLNSFRLPSPALEGIPGLKNSNVNMLHFPKDLAIKGVELGEKNRLGEILSVCINPEELRRHLYIMGQTGTGKSTLLKTIIHSLLQQKKGFCLIDPHGDLAVEAEKIIRANHEARSNFIILDPTDPNCSVKLNFLEYDRRFPEQKSLVINELFKVFTELYDMKQAGGPMFEQYFRNGMLALLSDEYYKEFGNPTFDEFKRFYFETTFRETILEKLQDQSIKQFFRNALQMHGEMDFINFAPYITSKVNRISDDFYLSKFVNTKESNIDLRNIMDTGKILIVKLDKGKIGSENVVLFGQLLFNKLNLVAMSRGNIPPENRIDYSIIVDEFQNFTRGDIGSLMSELRKYRVNMIMANQTLGQLEPDVVNSLLGNVGSLIFFRPGIKDYELLKYFLKPEFTRKDVLKLGNFNCIARIMIDNIPSDPFIFQTKLG